MPNWSTNILTIRGPEAQVGHVVRELDGCVLDPESIDALTYVLSGGEERVGELAGEMFDTGWVLSFRAHVPDPIERTGPDGDWYRARLRAWGTKWDASDPTVIDRGPGVVQYRFDTAWSPPLEWFLALVAARPELEMELAAVEESEGWLGSWTSEAGSDSVLWDGASPSEEELVELFGWYPDDIDDE